MSWYTLSCCLNPHTFIACGSPGCHDDGSFQCLCGWLDYITLIGRGLCTFYWLDTYE